jgi:hypothetical protein
MAGAAQAEGNRRRPSFPLQASKGGAGDPRTDKESHSMGLFQNHNQTLMAPEVGINPNHNQTIVPLDPSIKIANHNQTAVRPVPYPGLSYNHNQTLVRG